MEQRLPLSLRCPLLAWGQPLTTELLFSAGRGPVADATRPKGRPSTRGSTDGLCRGRREPRPGEVGTRRHGRRGVGVPQREGDRGFCAQAVPAAPDEKHRNGGSRGIGVRHGSGPVEQQDLAIGYVCRENQQHGKDKTSLDAAG